MPLYDIYYNLATIIHNIKKYEDRSIPRGARELNLLAFIVLRKKTFKIKRKLCQSRFKTRNQNVTEI